LSKIFDKVVYVCEKKPYIRSEITIKKKYFEKVKETEKKIFKRINLKKMLKK